jgi:hypothetical protein
VPRLVVRLIARLVVDYFDYVARSGASARRAVRRRLLRLRRASECIGTSRGSSSTTSPTPCVQVPQLVARLVAPLVVDYSASCRLVIDYFASAACPGASTRRTARHAGRH